MLRLWGALRRWLDEGGWVEPKSADVPAWRVEERPRGTVYSGAYAVHNARGRLIWQVPGRIVARPGLPAEVYIWNPPPALRRHRQGRCLQLLAPGTLWFRLHWERPAWDWQTGRTYVEQLLSEALRERYSLEP